MPINTDISYYYTKEVENGRESYKLRPLNYFDLLQLPRDFVADDVKAQIRRLFIAFHPDHRPDNKILREEVFKKMAPAWETLKNPVKREGYLRSLDAPSAGFRFVPFTPPSPEEAARIYREYMATFTELNEDDTFDVIYRQLALRGRATMLTLKQIGEQVRLFTLLKQKASTGDEFYRLVLLQRTNNVDYGHPSGVLLQHATNAGHIQAMRMRIGYVFFGCYTHREEQIAWALDCIKYIEEIVIPALSDIVAQQNASTDLTVQTSASGFQRPSRSSPQSVIRHDLVEGLQRVRARIALPSVIPAKGTSEYDGLLAQLNATIERPNPTDIVDLPVPEPVEVLASRYQSGAASQPLEQRVLDVPVVVSLPPVTTRHGEGVSSVSLDAELGTVPQGLSEDPLRRVKDGLQAYLNKIEKTYGSKFDQGFRFFKESQAENRLANYLLTQALLRQLNEGDAVETVFSSKKDLKELRCRLMQGKKFRDHGINSKDLNKVISLGITMAKEARKTTVEHEGIPVVPQQGKSNAAPGRILR